MWRPTKTLALSFFQGNVGNKAQVKWAGTLESCPCHTLSPPEFSLRDAMFMVSFEACDIVLVHIVARAI